MEKKTASSSTGDLLKEQFCLFFSFLAAPGRRCRLRRTLRG
jgi:hypothetical protein